MIDTSKIIHAPVGGGRYTVTAPIVKEDYGLYLKIEGLELPSTYEVDFSNSEHNGTSVTMIGNSDGVLIPSQFISSGKDVFAFLYHVGADFGRTVYKFRIPNKVRPDRTNEQPTPEEQSTIDQAISALNSAVTATAQDVIDADASARSASESAEQAQESARTAGLYSDTAQTYANSAEISANSASASATASAQSAEASARCSSDAQDSAEEAQGYASASAQSASASANSASQASGYAQSASASATSAQGYASQAQTSAQTASAKASEASTSASTASQKATEASQSATNAQTYASNAESAKTDAQTAQGIAESAKDDAITAKNGAESARDEAQTIVDGVSGKVDQIDQNTADIASLEADRYKPYAVDSASGAIASFVDGADNIPLKSLTVNIDPVQNLHGYDSPWAGGAGKNLLDPTLLKDQAGWNVIPIKVKPSTKYTCSTTDRPINVGLYIYFNNTGAQGGGSATQVTVEHPVTLTSTEDGYVYVTQRNSGTDSFANYHWQIEEGESATAYAPYENICPISGWTEVNVKHSDADMTNATTITIDLGQTVYGGKLDVLSGVLTVDRASKTITFTEDSGTVLGTYKRVSIPINPVADVDRRHLTICNLSGTYKNAFSEDSDHFYITTSGGTGYCFVPVGTSGELQFVYPLETPIEIQLSANQINSLLGVNNIWADTGDVSCEYRADTKLYIERLTAPEEDDMIADSAITSGQFFMVGNSLYRALANIASGATITVGTNAQRVSLSDALNLVNA